MSSRTFDTLISYRHEDAAFVRELVARLAKLNVAVFLDEKAHRDGLPWSREWTDALAAKPNPELAPDWGPNVVVIATDRLADQREPGKDVVVREVADAFNANQEHDHEVPVTVLRFGEAGVAELQRRLHAENPDYRLEDRHWPPAFDGLDLSQLSDAGWHRICLAVVRASRSTLLSKLETLRDEAAEWADQTLRQCWSPGDFAEGDPARQKMRAAGRMLGEEGHRRRALVGPGGFGKTIEMARDLREVLNRPDHRIFPVIVEPGDLERGLAGLRQRLGLGETSEVEPFSLLDTYIWAQGQIIFITDSLERADNVPATAAALQELDKAGSLWVTCRSEAWREANNLLAFDPAEIVHTVPVSAELAEDLLKKPIGKRDFLLQPVFLDIALHLKAKYQDVEAESQTALLGALWHWACEDDNVASDENELEEDRREFLALLARTQIQKFTFDIPRDHLLADDPAIRRRQEQALEHLLRRRPVLVESPRGIRARHDIVDSDNMAALLLSTGQLASFQREHIDRGFAQVVLETAMQVAADTHHPTALAEFFSLFLEAVDNKHDTDNWQTKGWNLGYVVAARLPLFLDMIKSVLAGDLVPADARSSLAEQQLTQHALSSVASMFLGARPRSIEDLDGSWLSILREKIDLVRFRARLIEAVARLRHSDHAGLSYLRELAHDQDKLEADPELSQYIAIAWTDFAMAADRTAQLEAAEGLGHLIRFLDARDDAILLPTARIVCTHLNKLHRPLHKPLLERPHTEKEIIAGLALHARGRTNVYSDWRTFASYAEWIRRQQGSDSDPATGVVVEALGRGFWHDHARCNEDAIRTLGTIDTPAARGLLLHFLSVETNDRSETALLQALDDQKRRLNGDPRTAFLLAGRRAAAERLVHLGGSDGRAGEIETLFEEIPTDAAYAGWIGGPEIPVNPRFEHREVPEPPVDWLSESERTADVGPELEEKFRLVGLGPEGLIYTRGTWAVPVRTARALRRRLRYLPRQARKQGQDEDKAAAAMRVKEYDQSLSHQVEAVAQVYTLWERGYPSDMAIPSLACAHVVVTTLDRQVVIARRAKNSEFYPDAWAHSFEEQMNAADFASPDPLSAATLRGLKEEFGFQAGREQLRIAAAELGWEWPTLSPTVLLHAEFLDTAEAFLTHARLAADELQQVTTCPLDDAIARRSGEVHPTSQARLALATT